MADNFPQTPGSGRNVATDEVAYSGEIADVQLTRIVQVTGSEGSKTVVDLPGDATDGLLVNLGANNDVAVTGSVTANAGTNLNTSALALESGGNLAGSATSLAIIDDWDEADRCKVNPIAGQAGVQGGAGTVTALTQRVAIATDANAISGTVTAAQGTAANLNATVVQGTAANLKTEPAGHVAHGATDSGNPLKTGARAISDLAAATMVTAAQRTDALSDLDGQLLVKPLVPFGNILSERVTITSGTSTALSTFGATASARNFITTIIVHNSSTTDTFVDIRDGTAGTVLMTLPLPQKGGAVVNLPVPLRQPTANTALAYQVGTGVTTAYLTFVGFKSRA